MTAKTLNDREPLYTVGVVADRLGIPTATLRSWTRRYGVGPLDHPRGRHRLYTDHDLAVLRRMRQLIRDGVSVARAARVATGAEATAESDTASLLTAAVALDADAVGHVIDLRLRECGVVDTWDGLIRPAFAALTDLQIDDGGCVDVEHLLSRAATRALQRLPGLSGHDESGLILACCDGEGHTLPLEALAAALAQAGRGSLMLGGSVPTASLCHALSKRPDVETVVLWSQVGSTADPAAARTIASVGVRVMVAGPGWDDVALPDGIVHLATLTAALEVLGTAP